MNAVIAFKSFSHLRSDLHQPCIQIQGNVATGIREVGGANERPYLATRRRNELGQLRRLHMASDYSGPDPLRSRQFDFVRHLLVGLT
jgi:hypothetical protein